MQSSDEKIENARKLIIEACDLAKANGLSIRRKGFSSCPLGHLAKFYLATQEGNHPEGNHPIDLAQEILAITLDEAWSFVYAFDGAYRDLSKRHLNNLDPNFWALGEEMAKKYV